MRDQAQIEQLLTRWREFLKIHFAAVEGESLLEVLLQSSLDESIKRRPELAKLRGDPRFQKIYLTPERMRTMSDVEYAELFEPVNEYYGSGIIISDHVVIMRTLLEHLEKPATILDVGCGPCSVLIFLQSEGILQAKAFGLDPSPGILAQARRIMRKEKVKVALRRGWAKALPFEDSSFEQVISIDAIHWSEAWREALKEMARVTANGGKIFVSYSLHSPRRQIDPTDAIAVLASSGIDVQDISHFTADKSGTPRVFLIGTKQKPSSIIVVPGTTGYMQ